MFAIGINWRFSDNICTAVLYIILALWLNFHNSLFFVTLISSSWGANWMKCKRTLTKHRQSDVPQRCLEGLPLHDGSDSSNQWEENLSELVDNMPVCLSLLKKLLTSGWSIEHLQFSDGVLISAGPLIRPQCQDYFKTWENCWATPLQMNWDERRSIKHQRQKMSSLL